MRNTVIPGLALLVLAGCATHPDSIAPRDTDAAQFQPYSCAELNVRAVLLDAEIQDYADSQNRARIGDFFVPTSRLFGKNGRNVEAIARLRGELAAVERVRTQKRCPASPTHE